jgi:hypothetical protein
MTRKSCTKIRHETRESAERHLAELVAAGRERSDRSLHTYWCDVCRAFHVGHASRQRQRKTDGNQ